MIFIKINHFKQSPIFMNGEDISKIIEIESIVNIKDIVDISDTYVSIIKEGVQFNYNIRFEEYMRLKSKFIAMKVYTHE